MRNIILIMTALHLLLIKTETMAQIFSLNMNTISPVVLALQSELEVSVSQKYTMSMGMTIKPFGKYRIGGTHISARRYLKESFVGLSASFSAGYLTYNITKEKEKAGQSIYTAISAGYNFILTKRLNLKLELGAALFFTRDKHIVHTPDPWEGDYRHTTERVVLLPYPISISICYIF